MNHKLNEISEDNALEGLAQSPIRSLSVDLLGTILDYIYDALPSSLDSLMFVNKVFYCSAFRLRHRHKCFDIYESGAFNKGPRENRGFSFQLPLQNRLKDPEYLLLNLHQDPNHTRILQSIRSIAVKYVSRSGEEDSGTWEPFAELLSRITYLKTVTFNENGTSHVPLPFLKALEKYHPEARLHVKGWARVKDDEDHDNAAENALAHSPNLRSIEARLWNCDAQYDLRFPALKRIIALSPHLEEVKFKEGVSGCVVRGMGLKQYEEQHRLSRLFDVKPSLNSINTIIANRRVMDIAEVTDMSKLERLETSIYCAQQLLDDGNLSSLKHLSLRVLKAEADFSELLERFLERAHPLESLAITHQAPNFISVDTVLRVHGPTLRKVVLHEPETTNVVNPRKVLSLRAIQIIGLQCPLLEDITLDLENSLDKPSLKAVAQALAAFPNLKVIRFYLPLGIADNSAQLLQMMANVDATFEEQDPSKQFDPLDDDEWLEKMWAFFRSEKKKRQTPGLRELHVKVGEWEREIGVGHPAQWVLWEQSNRAYFIAKPHGRDDRKDEIEVETLRNGYEQTKICETREIPEVVDGIFSSAESRIADEEIRDWI